MKANSLVKKEMTIERIRQDIETRNNEGNHKTFVPHYVFISDETKLQLLKDGFKVYVGAWDGIMINCIIIEW